MPSKNMAITNRPSSVSSRFDDDGVATIKLLLSRFSSGSKRRSTLCRSGFQSLCCAVAYTFFAGHLLTILGAAFPRVRPRSDFSGQWHLCQAYMSTFRLECIKIGFYYFSSGQVRRGIIYGDKARNKLDLYIPKNNDGRPKPVLVFVTGGAWTIGHRAWGSLLGQQLSERNIMVASIDYRNYPCGTVSKMIKDASQAISFVCNNIAEYGGDPNKIFLMGQSEGAHISACALVDQAIKEASKRESITWSLSQIKTYFGLSGGYNLVNLVDYFDSRGFHRRLFLRIMEGEQTLRRFSPELRIQNPNVASAASLLPPMVLFHGTGDYSIPSNASKSFAETLKRLGVNAEAVLYEGKTHTDLFLNDPMRGGKDAVYRALLKHIHADDPKALAEDEAAPPRRRLVPEFMVSLAHKVSPF